MIRALNRWLTRWASRRLSAIAHEDERARLKAKTRQLRAELGLPALEIFE